MTLGEIAGNFVEPIRVLGPLLKIVVQQLTANINVELPNAVISVSCIT